MIDQKFIARMRECIRREKEGEAAIVSELSSWDEENPSPENLSSPEGQLWLTASKEKIEQLLIKHGFGEEIPRRRRKTTSKTYCRGFPKWDAGE